MKHALNFPRHSLVSAGTCFGKFTKSGKFHLHVTALEFLAPYAQVGVKWGRNETFRFG